MTINWRPVAAVVAALMVLSGCGGGGDSTAKPKAEQSSTKQSSPPPRPLEGLSPGQILEKSVAAARAEGSVHISGVAEQVSMDIRTSATGDGQGTLSFPGEGKVDVLVRAGQIYLKGDKVFWTKTANKSVAQILSGKWLKDDKKDPQFGDLAKIISLEDFLKEGLKPEGRMTRVPGRDVDGQATVGLLDTTSDGQQVGTLFVAELDAPLPLLVVSAEGEQVSLSEWGEPVEVAAPPQDLVIDIAELQNAG